MKLSELVNLTYSRDRLIDFLIEHGVLAATMTCDNCRKMININKETLLFVCRKRYFIKNKHKKRISAQCNFKKSAKVGTWFDRIHTDVDIICRLTAYFVMVPPPRQTFLQFDTGLSSTTVTDWINYCREVCIYWARKNSQKLGGPGHTVEIDGAKIDRKKYNCGEIIQGNWIYGGYERETKKIFIVPVEVGTEETLLETINEWILPKTNIISNFWKSYKCFKNKDFQNLNHLYNFIDPETDKQSEGVHTRDIECAWREVRANIPRYGNTAWHFLRYFSEYLFKRVHDLDVRIETFFNIIGELYPPISNVKQDQQTL